MHHQLSAEIRKNGKMVGNHHDHRFAITVIIVIVIIIIIIINLGQCMVVVNL